MFESLFIAESNGNNAAHERKAGQEEPRETKKDGDGSTNAGTTGNSQEVR